MTPNPTSDATPGGAPKPRQRRLRKFLRVAMVLLALLAIFHRPLFHAGLRLALIQLAHRQNLSLDVRFSGNVFTQLIVDQLQVRPANQLPTPVERIDIEHLQLDYSIPMLVKHGPGEFLRRYTIRNSQLAFTARPSQSPRDQARKRSLAANLNRFLAQPAGFADHVEIENFNLAIHLQNEEEFSIQGADLKLDPEQPGYLRIKSLQLPKAPVWRDLSAETSYAERNFYLHALTLTPDIVIDEANFDASLRARNKAGVIIKGKFFGGTADFKLTGSKLQKDGETLQKSYDLEMSLELAGISLQRFGEYFHLPKIAARTLTKGSLKFRGEPEQPQTWQGTADTHLGSFRIGELTFDTLDVRAAFDQGSANIQSAELKLGDNTLELRGTVGLPQSVKQFSQSSFATTLHLHAPQVAQLNPMVAAPWSGAITGDGILNMEAGLLSTELTLKTSSITNQTSTLGATTLHFSASKLFKPRASDTPAPPFVTDLKARLNADIANFQHKNIKTDGTLFDAKADSAQIVAELENGKLILRQFKVAREENVVSLHGSYQLPQAAAGNAETPIEGQFTIHAPRLAAFGIATQGQVLNGEIEGGGTLNYRSRALNGNVTINGRNFQLGAFKANQLAVKTDITDNIAEVEQFALNINPKTQIAAAGKMDLRAPFSYEGGAIVSIENLAVFQPLLDLFGVNQTIKGSLQVDLNASSKPPLTPGGPITQGGDLKFVLSKAAYGKLNIDDFTLAGIYGTGFAQSTQFHLQSGPTQLSASLELREGKLRWRDIALQQGKLTVLTGFIIAPFDASNLKQPIPPDAHIAANVNAKELDLDQLLASFGQSAPVSGIFSANLLASGTPLEPAAHLKVTARKLKAKATPQLEPSELDLALHYSTKVLSLDAALRQPQMQPLTIKGRAPLDLGQTLHNKKIDPNLPLALTVKLPTSSLALAPKLSAAVRRIDGQASLDASISGTVANPIYNASALINIQSARLINEAAPAIGGFQAHLILADEKLSLKTFRGEVGGGTFSLSGAVALPKFNEPNFDLRLRTDHVLVKRDDTITVRIDTDLKLAGPLNTASATGQIYVTDSRFFREIDILPIGLPGRPKPKPQSAPSTKTLSFEKAPLRDWKFDITIKTRADDPFRIRGNLANGGAAINLKFAGTGLHPTLDGTISIENFVASLPFSKLTVSRGYVYFSPESPFRPLLDIQAESTIRDYRVDAYIYGSTSDPQVSLTSEPPLPQADVVSLLATGTTANELTGNSNVLAGRAAVLVFQELYHKIFKKRAPLDEQTLLDRFNLDVGAVDSRTGRQEISTQFRLSDQLYLIGDVDVTGNFTGRLRYLLRFR